MRLRLALMLTALLIAVAPIPAPTVAQNDPCSADLLRASQLLESAQAALGRGDTDSALTATSEAHAILTRCVDAGLPGFTPVDHNADWTPLVQDFDGVEMVLVPAGCFMMGSDGADNVVMSRDDELPVHEQCFEIPFWLDRTEVTAAMYMACIEAGACAVHIPSLPFFRDNQPFDYATWYDAHAYCAWRGARLPTEAEWEYAARGPDNLVYPWGNTFVPDYVVYSFNSDGETADVGSKPAGASWVGALDMSGNAWEWVSSLYLPYPYDPTDGRERASALGTRVVRGGAWYDYVSCDRAANRFWQVSVSSGNGFRCARDY